MKHWQILCLLLAFQSAEAQKIGTFSKKDGELKYLLQLNEDSKFVFESSVFTHRDTVSVFEIGVYQVKGDTILLLVEKYGSTLTELFPTKVSRLATRAGRKKIYFYGNGGISIVLKRQRNYIYVR